MNIYKRHRFPPDIISYAVWIYYRFNLSHRDIEDLLAQRGITVSREAIRLWCASRWKSRLSDVQFVGHRTAFSSTGYIQVLISSELSFTTFAACIQKLQTKLNTWFDLKKY